MILDLIKDMILEKFPQKNMEERTGRPVSVGIKVEASLNWVAPTWENSALCPVLETWVNFLESFSRDSRTISESKYREDSMPPQTPCRKVNGVESSLVFNFSSSVIFLSWDSMVGVESSSEEKKWRYFSKRKSMP